MNEELVIFGQADSLVGILTTGDAEQPPAVGCLLPNVGLAHRIGPHRLTVKVARSLSSLGVASLRFDLSGIGDSPTTKSADLIQQAMTDMRSAMDCMHQRLGINRFVVFGICSGAQNGYFLSLQDERIVGVLMYDGFEFPSISSKLVHQIDRARATPWRRIVAKVRQRLLGQGQTTKAPLDIFSTALIEMHPTPAQFALGLEKLVARGVSVYSVFSGSRRAHDFGRGLYGALGRAAFMRGITYRFDADLDHTATSLVSQRRLLGMIGAWAAAVVAADGPQVGTSSSERGVRAAWPSLAAVARPHQRQATPDP